MNIAPLPLHGNEPERQQRELERRLRDDRSAAESRARRLGDTLLGMNLINRKDAETISRIQKKTGEPFGRIAISRGYVRPDQLQAAIGVQFGLLREADGPINIPKRLTIVRHPHSKEAEKIRLMRTRLVTSCTPDDLKALSIIDVGKDNASVELAANLGAAFAQLHRRVLILDANLRKPTLRNFFLHNEKSKGLSDYLTGRARFEDIIQPSLVNRLDLITEGQRAYNPQILLSSDQFDALLTRARRDYDVILLLSSGYGPIADGQFVWQKSDSALVITRKHKNSEDELKQLSAILYDLNTPILGAVVAR